MLIDCLRSNKQYFSHIQDKKFVSKKSERGDFGMGQHGQWLNTGTCFSVSSDKLVLFLFPGIPTGDPSTYKVRNEIETKRNEINENETKRNEINEMKTK